MLEVAREYSCTHDELAQGLNDSGYHCAVLNMASSRNPGGGVRDGNGAQEENLHRRPDAFRFLERQVQDTPGLYPIPSEGCL
eukprot:11280638-Alexandrium_andersonii.AAC.1